MFCSRIHFKLNLTKLKVPTKRNRPTYTMWYSSRLGTIPRGLKCYEGYEDKLDIYNSIYHKFDPPIKIICLVLKQLGYKRCIHFFINYVFIIFVYQVVNDPLAGPSVGAIFVHIRHVFLGFTDLLQKALKATSSAVCAGELYRSSRAI